MQSDISNWIHGKSNIRIENPSSFSSVLVITQLLLRSVSPKLRDVKIAYHSKFENYNETRNLSITDKILMLKTEVLKKS